MNIISPDKGTEIFNQNGCLGTRLLTAQGIEVVRLTVGARPSVLEHSLPFPVIFYVLDGEGTLLTETGPRVIDAGTTIECPPDSPRGWENRSVTDLNILVIKCMAG